MRLPAWRWLAISSLTVWPVAAEVRPHYGGTLTAELSTVWSTLEPAASLNTLSFPIAETLVRINTRGQAEPVLAVAWQHDPDFKSWRFSLRPKVTFHDGEALTGASAAPSLLAFLKQKYADVTIESGGQALVVQANHAIPELLDELGLPQAAIFHKTEQGPLIGTGPFRVTAWEPGRRVALAAFDDYWGGRPFLDGVAIESARTPGHADLFDIPAGPARRIIPEGWTTWSSPPRGLVAITTASADPSLVQALALTIDRAPIANVLAQHKAEAAFSLLPQWLSGYSFLFRSATDVARAKQIVSQVHTATATLGYPPNDPFLRSIAERVALNARDAGITIQPTPAASANLRLVEWPLESADTASELKRIADVLGAGDRASQLDRQKPESLYQFERALLDEHRILPLVFLRETYSIAPRVHFRSPLANSSVLHLDDAWVNP